MAVTFDGDFMRRLESLNIIARKVFATSTGTSTRAPTRSS
jgi:hypothetical protein